MSQIRLIHRFDRTTVLGFGLGLTLTLCLVPAGCAHAKEHNNLSSEEAKAGWALLFDGKSTKGWRGAHEDSFPKFGWVVKDGTLRVLESGGGESEHGGDIVTEELYSDFELEFEFKLTKGANSGVKYFVTEQYDIGKGSAIGLEFQVLDDERHPDAKKGVDGNRTIGSLYDLIPAKDKKVNPIGQWNKGHLKVKGGHVEHWLNGVKVVEYDRFSQMFDALVGKSKYRDFEGFGVWPQGRILLQDHGNEVWFRNIKIRRL